MSNLYGITLDPAWTEWAVKEKVSETVAEAVLLICQNRGGNPLALVIGSSDDVHAG
jgi:hypothetical protein